MKTPLGKFTLSLQKLNFSEIVRQFCCYKFIQDMEGSVSTAQWSEILGTLGNDFINLRHVQEGNYNRCILRGFRECNKNKPVCNMNILDSKPPPKLFNCSLAQDTPVCLVHV